MEKLQFETCAFEFQTSHCQPCHFKFQYFACLLLTFATEAVAGILGFLYRDKVGTRDRVMIRRNHVILERSNRRLKRMFRSFQLLLQSFFPN